MDTNTKKKITTENYWDKLVHDSPSVYYELSKINYKYEDEPAEIVTELPSAVCIDIILSMVSRWLELQKMLGRPLRVYAWSSERTVEKYVLGCLSSMDKVCMTVLPMHLKREMKYVK